MSTYTLPYNRGEENHGQTTNFSTDAFVEEIFKSWWFKDDAIHIPSQGSEKLDLATTSFSSPSELNLQQQCASGLHTMIICFVCSKQFIIITV